MMSRGMVVLNAALILVMVTASATASMFFFSRPAQQGDLGLLMQYEERLLDLVRQISIGSASKALWHGLQAVELMPEDVEHLWNLADVYEAANQPLQAMNTVAEILRHPDLDHVPKLLERIRAMEKPLR